MTRPLARLAVEPLEDRVALAADAFEENDTLATAADLGVIRGGVIYEHLSLDDAADFYRFTLERHGGQGHHLTLNFSEEFGDLDLKLYTPQGDLIGTADHDFGYQSLWFHALEAGTYVAEVSATGGASNAGYTLTFDAPAAVRRDDRFAGNDTRADATNLGTVTGARAVRNLALDAGGDWFRFRTTRTGGRLDRVAIAFEHGLGDLDLQLYTRGGRLLGESHGTADREWLSLGGLSAGLYFVRVVGHEGAVNPAYDLGIVGPSAVRRPRPVTTGLNLAPADWVAQNVQTPALQTVVLTVGADRQLDRADYLQIFATVEGLGSTVSASSFTDLKTLVNSGYFSMPDYVANLAAKLINGNPANLYYQGQALGNLAAGVPTTTLENLVNKWFLGLDHPQVPEVEVNGQMQPAYAYGPAAGTLFAAGGPVFTDISQGATGDCYFLSTLGTTAVQMPDVIQDMFIDNGDGTFTVRYYQSVNGQAVSDYVTVDRNFPMLSTGYFAYANHGRQLSDSTNVLWVPLAEKAWAQINEEGWLGHTHKCENGDQGECLNSYYAISFGSSQKAMFNVAGTKAVGFSDQHFDATAIATAFQSGELVTFWTCSTVAGIGDPCSMPISPEVVPAHVYAMVAYEANTQTITLYNPYGFGNPDDKLRPTLLTVTAAELTSTSPFLGFEGWNHSV